jgi:predicted RNA binding protein YcfA (HicA-like mRNA interferase family)
VTTVPDHRGRDISPGLLRKILEDIRVGRKTFFA